MAYQTKTDLRNNVIYSVYVRNYSEEGTFAAVERDLDRIKGLGVDIIWFLPICPIGEEKRKGMLGSPYAIADYRKVNPELGTMEEFKHLVEEIHARDMKSMLDIVYNHTSPDSWLAENRPEYFYRTPEGKMGNRVGDWGDIVDLDYGNKDLWEYQIETLKMWAGIVDGFRCDVAPLVPLEFWKKAREEVAGVNPDCIWLSESVEPEFIAEIRARGMTALSDSEIFQAFDMSYDYDIYRYFRRYLSGEGTLGRYIEAVNMQECIYPANYVKMRYLENHDQDRAEAIISGEDALRNWTAFLYFQKGATLLYAGQENRNENRPDLFNKDVINLDGSRDISEQLRRLYRVKKLPVAADSSYHLRADDGLGAVVGEHRKIQGSGRLLGVFSFEGKSGQIEVEIEDGIYENMADGKKVQVKDGKVDLKVCPVIIEEKGQVCSVKSAG